MKEAAKATETDRFELPIDTQSVAKVLRHPLLPKAASLALVSTRGFDQRTVQSLATEYGVAVEHIMNDTGASPFEINTATSYFMAFFSGSK